MKKSKRKIINYAIDIININNVIYTISYHFVDIPRPIKIIIVTTVCISLILKLILWKENPMIDNIFSLLILIFIIGVLICGMIGIL